MSLYNNNNNNNKEEKRKKEKKYFFSLIFLFRSIDKIATRLRYVIITRTTIVHELLDNVTR